MYSEAGQPGVDPEIKNSVEVEDLLPQVQEALDQYYIKWKLGDLDPNPSDQERLYDNFIRAYLATKGVPSHLYDSLESGSAQKFHLVSDNVMDLEEATGVLKTRLVVQSKFVNDQDQHEVLFDAIVDCRVSKMALDKVKQVLAERDAEEQKEEAARELKVKQDFLQFLSFALEHIDEPLTAEQWNTQGMPDSVFGTMSDNMEWGLEKTANNRLTIKFWNKSHDGGRGSMRDAYEFDLPNE